MKYKPLFTSVYKDLDLTPKEIKVLDKVVRRSIQRFDELIRTEPRSKRREQRIDTIGTLEGIARKLKHD